jgi:23S rRNA (cytosine1962-C5)-methyltransferase
MELSKLCALVDRAIEARRALVDRFRAEDTDAYRLFHGIAEGCEGLTIDRYGPLVLVQTFRAPLTVRDVAELEAHLRSRLAFDHELVYNHRTERGSEWFDRWHRPREEALREVACRELGVRYFIRGRHAGRDPWLFLDLRSGRRFVRAHAAGKSVLNLFAYTCSSGVCAAVQGASEVWNVDFSHSHLAVGAHNARSNGIDLERMRFIAEDCLPVLRQLAGLPVKGRASSRPYAKLVRREFDLVVLDPPAWSKSAFGAVDVERDYASLFKPALLATASGGKILCTNHVASVALEDWIESLRRCAHKAGRPVRAVEVLEPESDFPSHDGDPPLKIAVCEV